MKTSLLLSVVLLFVSASWALKSPLLNNGTRTYNRVDSCRWVIGYLLVTVSRWCSSLYLSISSTANRFPVVVWWPPLMISLPTPTEVINALVRLISLPRWWLDVPLTNPCDVMINNVGNCCGGDGQYGCDYQCVELGQRYRRWRSRRKKVSTNNTHSFCLVKDTSPRDLEPKTTGVFPLLTTCAAATQRESARPTLPLTVHHLCSTDITSTPLHPILRSVQW